MKVNHKHTALNGKKKFISFASPKSQESFFFYFFYFFELESSPNIFRYHAYLFLYDQINK